MTMNRGHQWAGQGRVEKLITFLLREGMACSYEVKGILTTRINFVSKIRPKLFPSDAQRRFLIAVKQMP